MATDRVLVTIRVHPDVKRRMDLIYKDLHGFASKSKRGRVKQNDMSISKFWEIAIEDYLEKNKDYVTVLERVESGRI